MSIQQNLTKLHQKIADACVQYQRNPNSVQLLAVSKRQSIEHIQEAIQAQQTCFAENYVQDALPKIRALTAYPLEWHFIGTVQKNKTKAIAEHFSWVHTVADEVIARRLHEQRPAELPPLNICIQVNLDAEPQKGGILLEAVAPLLAKIHSYTKLNCRGLMAIPKPMHNFAEQRANFHRLTAEFNRLIKQGYPLDTLSIGMSDDFVAAIAEGSTMVRIGTAIFGERKNR